MGRLKPIEYLRNVYRKNPRLYTLGELIVVLGGIFLIIWVLRFSYWSPYLSTLVGIVSSLVLLSSFFVHQDSLKDLGIRVDNLRDSFKEVSVVILFSLAIVACIFNFYRETYRHHDLGRVLLDTLGYIFWGSLQQFFLNSFFYLRLKKVLVNKYVAIISAAVIFSLVHVPNAGLMICGLVGGLLFCFLFSRNRNIFTLGAMQGILAVATLTLLSPYPIYNYRVGPQGFERYSAFGDSVFVCSGDVTGDGKDEILATNGPAEGNDPEIFVFTGDGVPVSRFPAFDTPSPYGAAIAAGDVDGDGKDEIIAARGPWRKNDTLITVLTGAGERLTSFVAFPGKKYGVNVAAGDLNGDGRDEIIAALGPGQRYRPLIRVFTGSGQLLAEFRVNDLVHNDEYYQYMRNGIRVSAGDLDGDGKDEIVGAPPYLHAYRTHFITIDFPGVITAPGQSKWHWVYFSRGTVYGLSTAVGDLDGDGTAEVIAGPGPYFKAAAELIVMNADGSTVSKALPFDTHFGLIVATADTDGDGISEILAAPGIGAERDVGIVKVLGPGGMEKELDLRPYLK
jgi:hypothetical protein